jgi:hypothetical protein
MGIFVRDLRTGRSHVLQRLVTARGSPPYESRRGPETQNPALAWLGLGNRWFSADNALDSSAYLNRAFAGHSR